MAVGLGFKILREGLMVGRFFKCGVFTCAFLGPSS
jgi:hypothetical protein